MSIDAKLLTEGSTITYVNFSDVELSFNVAEINKSPVDQILADGKVVWEVTDTDGNVWVLFVVQEDDNSQTVQTLYPKYSSMLFDVVSVS